MFSLCIYFNLCGDCEGLNFFPQTMLLPILLSPLRNYVEQVHCTFMMMMMMMMIIIIIKKSTITTIGQ